MDIGKILKAIVVVIDQSPSRIEVLARPLGLNGL